MIKPELLAPAKDLKKAKFAIDYGADAVYIGGKMFSLRSREIPFLLNRSRIFLICISVFLGQGQI